MKEKLNYKDFSSVISDINSILYYLEDRIGYSDKLVGFFMRFDCNDDGNITTDMSLNYEALDELVFQSKKISSKADILQNKVSELINKVK